MAPAATTAILKVMTDPVEKRLRIQLLGAFRIDLEGRTIEPDRWALRKSAAVLKLLALAPGHRLQREEMCELLWPEAAPLAARNNLRYALHAARTELSTGSGRGAAYVRRDGDWLVLSAPDGLATDVSTFEIAAAAAQRSRDPAERRAAIELYAGDLLPGDRYEVWASERREQLRQVHAELMASLGHLHEERRELDEAVTAFERLLSAEPTHEDAAIALMRLYAQTGRRHDALAIYRRLQEALRRHLEAEPDPETVRLHDEIMAGRVSDARVPRHNLPAALTSFVGRECEIDALNALLRDERGPRLLTLTGAGGCGKTRLAVEVAGGALDRFPSGLWLVELAGIMEPGLVADRIVSAIGVRESPTRPVMDVLVECLRGGAQLLILDNCEHLVRPCAEAAETLLRACPQLRVLATSRHALNVAGETVWRVPSLAQDDAARLLAERARRSRPGFALTSRNAADLEAICRRLDGLPLAIELAAARLRVLSPAEILVRLDGRFKLLTDGGSTTPPRHRTLRGVVDWSYALLAPAERTLFNRLSVFAGGFTLDAAEAVCGATIARLSRLVDKSLLIVEERSGRSRYRLLETFREYGRDRLDEVGELDEVARRHADHFLALAERTEAELRGPDQAATLDRLEDEHDNFRVALGWVLRRASAELDQTGEGSSLADLALRIAGSLFTFWWMRGHIGEGRRWVERALLLGGGPAARARALNAAGDLADFQNDQNTRRARHAEALALRRQVGASWEIGESLRNIGNIAVSDADWNRARQLYEQSVAIYRSLGEQWGIAVGVAGLAHVAAAEGDFESARDGYEEAVRILRGVGDAHRIAHYLNFCGEVFRRAGDLIGAARRHAEALQMFRRLEDWSAVAESVDLLACVLVPAGHAEEATRLFGATDVEWAGSTRVRWGVRKLERDEAEVRAAAFLGRDAFARARVTGAAMSLDAAMANALGAVGANGQQTPLG